MDIKQIDLILSTYIDSKKCFTIKKDIFASSQGRKNYNKIVKLNVDQKLYGIYLWINTANKEVIYIGMAGKIKNNGSISGHTLCDRLKASRKFDKEKKKDILTNDYIRNLMEENQIESLDFIVYYAKAGEPASYLEALLLYHYFKCNNKLPLLNKTF